MDNKFSVNVVAYINAPTVFSFELQGPFATSFSKITVTYGDGLDQILSGEMSGHNFFSADLSAAAGNNFASFLRGFTAGSTMSIVMGNQTADFDLKGTSTIVGALGQCTIADGFNQLPPPWRSAGSQPPQAPTTPSPVAPPAALAPPPANNWWVYSYVTSQCEHAPMTPKADYDALSDAGQGPTVDRVSTTHVRIEWPDASNPQLVNRVEFFRDSGSCQDFVHTLANQNNDLN